MTAPHKRAQGQRWALPALAALAPSVACQADAPAWTGPEHLSACRAEDGDPTSVTRLTTARAGASLSVELSFESYNQAHAFVLCWPTQSFEPPNHVALELWHDNNKPPDLYYSVLYSADLRFDISSLVDEWREQASAEGDSVDSAEATALTIELQGFTVEVPLD